MNKVQLNQYNNDSYTPGSTLKKTLWYFTNMIFFKTLLPFSSSFKVKLLKWFGAKVGNSVVIKPDVNVKYPWFLEIGDDCWIGEGVWIGAKATVCPGMTCHSHAVLAVGSVATKDLEAYKVYQGNPAEMKRERLISVTN